MTHFTGCQGHKHLSLGQWCLLKTVSSVTSIYYLNEPRGLRQVGYMGHTRYVQAVNVMLT